GRIAKKNIGISSAGAAGAGRATVPVQHAAASRRAVRKRRRVCGSDARKLDHLFAHRVTANANNLLYAWSRSTAGTGVPLYRADPSARPARFRVRGCGTPRI